METVVGRSQLPPPKQQDKTHGIDIVLGAQWGDEGKGKLVDCLSQVRCLFPSSSCCCCHCCCWKYSLFVCMCLCLCTSCDNTQLILSPCFTPNPSFLYYIYNSITMCAHESQEGAMPVTQLLSMALNTSFISCPVGFSTNRQHASLGMVWWYICHPL